jgi:hypothetical protein
MKRSRLAVAITVLALFGSAGGSVSAAETGPVAVVAKSCSSGYTHAVTPGGHKCLRRGQFCSHKRGYQRAYHRAGFHCKRNGRLRFY